VVTDLQGAVLARGRGPSSNMHNVGFEESCRALETAIAGALAQVPGRGLPVGAGPETPFAAACFGLSGVDAPQDEAQVSAWVRARGIAPRFAVVNDAELVLAGGSPEGWGVALISGTGSVCLGRAQDGRTARVGGWGPLLGDEGSGYDIAIRAMRMAAQTADGRAQAPALLEAVLRHWSVAAPAELIRFVHAPSLTTADIAGFAPVVLEMAARGDAAAAAVVGQAARELARYVDVVVEALGLCHPPLALAGGLLQGTFRDTVAAAITSPLGPSTFVVEPETGAVVLARRLLSEPAQVN
jgi:N-acetylglucosamine kinase-like BadF-type ATPase